MNRLTITGKGQYVLGKKSIKSNTPFQVVENKDGPCPGYHITNDHSSLNYAAYHFAPPKEVDEGPDVRKFDDDTIEIESHRYHPYQIKHGKHAGKKVYLPEGVIFEDKPDDMGTEYEFPEELEISDLRVYGSAQVDIKENIFLPNVEINVSGNCHLCTTKSFELKGKVSFYLSGSAYSLFKAKVDDLKIYASDKSAIKYITGLYRMDLITKGYAEIFATCYKETQVSRSDEGFIHVKRLNDKIPQ